MKKVYNFSAGPAVLPEPVLEQAAEAVMNYNGHGMSILEMSHRSAPIVEMVAETRQLVS
ncbi:MAG: aminotransferase class V-fold PLP-dependent enzyme, partial [Fidelibacterota bacterium]